jgi:hypothetical protein
MKALLLAIALCLGCGGADQKSDPPPPRAQETIEDVSLRWGRAALGGNKSEALALSMTHAQLRALSEAIAKLPPPAPPPGPPDPARMKRGLDIIEGRHCTSCHGRDFAGHDNVPRVASQREDYLLKTLRDYRSGARIGYGNAVMPETLAGLDDAQLADIAHFLAHIRN